MATTTAAAPPTPEQIAEAIEIVRRLCAEAGQHPEISVERFVYPDDEDGDEPTLELHAPLRTAMPMDEYFELVKRIANHLASERLLYPTTALSLAITASWG